MWNSDENFIAATCEVMGLHVSEKTRRVSEMHEDVYTRLRSMMLKHQELPTPPQVGHRMSVPNR